MRASSPVKAYIGIGSNLQDPVRQVSQAIISLDHLPQTRLVARSSLYRTKPVGPADQPDFINAVACVKTRLAPQVLLTGMLALETASGRRRHGERWGPRTLDLDLLLYGSLSFEGALTIPHPRMAERSFVLIPLAEIAPGLDIPGVGSVSELAARLTSDEVHVLAPGS